MSVLTGTKLAISIVAAVFGATTLGVSFVVLKRIETVQQSTIHTVQTLVAQADTALVHVHNVEGRVVQMGDVIATTAEAIHEAEVRQQDAERRQQAIADQIGVRVDAFRGIVRRGEGVAARLQRAAEQLRNQVPARPSGSTTLEPGHSVQNGVVVPLRGSPQAGVQEPTQGAPTAPHPNYVQSAAAGAPPLGAL